MVWAFFAAPALGQLTIPTTGLLPASPLDHSLVLGDRQSALQSEWLAPVNAFQQSWVNSINSRANQSPTGAVPATFSQAAGDSSIAEAAGLRYAMTGDAADLAKSTSALLHAALPSQNSNDFITHTELLTSYLAAYDYIRGASDADLPAGTRATIETRLRTLAQNLSYGNNTASNARGKIGATKALAGELLGNQALLDTGLQDLQTHFNYSTTDDGWFTDSQSVYLDYTLRHLALFTRAYQQGSGVNLYADVQPLLDMSINLRQPEGNVPNVSNGLNWPVATHLFTNTPDADAAGVMLWNFEQLPVNAFGETNIDNNDYSNSTPFALTNFNATPTAPTASPTFFASGQSGVSVFRHDWSATSDYLLMSPGVDSPGTYLAPLNIIVPAFHSANDTGEIIVASGGHDILVAAGYDRDDLSNSPANFNPREAENHNVVLVDGALGIVGQGRAVRPEDFTHTDRLDATERGGFQGAADFATLQMEYGGAQIARSSSFANEDYFVVADRMQSSETHDYGFNLVGRGTRTVLTDTSELVEVRWEHEGRQVIEHLVSTRPMTLSLASTYLHDTFNNYEVTQRITATVSADNAGFLSVIETGPAGAAPQLVVTDLSAIDFAALKAANAAADYEDWILSQSAAALRTVEALTTDAEYAYLRHVAGQLDSAMIARGTLLGDDGMPIFQADNPLTLSLVFEPAEIRATISDDLFVPLTELDFFGRHILSATLGGVPIAFYNTPQFGGVLLPAGGELVIQFTSVPEPSTFGLFAVGAAAAAFAARRRRRARGGLANSPTNH